MSLKENSVWMVPKKYLCNPLMIMSLFIIVAVLHINGVKRDRLSAQQTKKIDSVLVLMESQYKRGTFLLDSILIKQDSVIKLLKPKKEIK